MTLPQVLFKCLARPFLAVLPSRLFVILFQYSQPMLVRLAIRFISGKPSETQSWQQGRWILAVAFFILVGGAVRTAPYHTRTTSSIGGRESKIY